MWWLTGGVPSVCPLRVSVGDRSSLRLVGHSRVVDALHTYLLVGLYWKYLVMCHGTGAPDCPSKFPW